MVKHYMLRAIEDADSTSAIPASYSKNDCLIPEIIESGIYKIDESGRIFTKRNLGGHVTDRFRPCLNKDGRGYLRIRHRGKFVSQHRIVFFYFNRFLKDLPINHKNGIRTDNRPENLELVSVAENNLHRFRVLGHRAVIGNPDASLERAKKIMQLRDDGMSVRQISAVLGVAKSTVSYTINGKIWKGHL